MRGAARVDVVPLVSAKTAWNQGAFGWSNAQRRSFLRWYQQAPRECAVGSGGRSGPGCGYVLQSNARLTAQVDRPDDAAGVEADLRGDRRSHVDPRVVGPVGRAGRSARDAGEGLLVLGRRDRPAAQPHEPGAAHRGGQPFLAPATAGRQWSTTQVLDAPAGPAIPASLFGLHVPELAAAAPQLSYEWLRLWDVKTGWEPLEQNRGTYYWKWIDDAVAYAEANGKKVMYVFGDTPGWAGPSAAYPPVDIAEYRRYVQAVVSRYGDRIDAFEVWNEPNLFVKASESLADLVEMTQIVHDTVKGAGLSSLVLTPSTTMRTGTAAYPFFSEYLVRLGGTRVARRRLHLPHLPPGGRRSRAARAGHRPVQADARAGQGARPADLGHRDQLRPRRPGRAPARHRRGRGPGLPVADVRRRGTVRGHPGRLVPVVPDVLRGSRHPAESRHDGDERGVAVDARPARGVLASGVRFRGVSRGLRVQPRRLVVRAGLLVRWLGRIGRGAGRAQHPVRHGRALHTGHRWHGDRRHPPHQAHLGLRAHQRAASARAPTVPGASWIRSSGPRSVHAYQ